MRWVLLTILKFAAVPASRRVFRALAVHQNLELDNRTRLGFSSEDRLGQARFVAAAKVRSASAKVAHRHLGA
jgi:ABC-type branched-subunit amino acid transport system ATPase component